jgi:excisionase family DNA binding protein
VPALSSPPRRYISTEEAADFLGVSKRTVRRWIDQGQLTGYRVGPRYIRVDANEVETAMVRQMPVAGGDPNGTAA